jgi:hypothetical protein
MCEINNNTELTDRFLEHLDNIENKASLEAKLKIYYSDGSGYTWYKAKLNLRKKKEKLGILNNRLLNFENV